MINNKSLVQMGIGFLPCFFALAAYAQKVEVEKRISEKEFPVLAKTWLSENFNDATHMRFFREYTSDTTNYEAKFCWKKNRYSVEFLKTGQLKDIEKSIPFSEVPEPGRAVIRQVLQADFSKYKIIKCQEQTRPGHPGRRYEMELKGKKSSQTRLYEYLFEEDGRLVLSRKIVLPSNNITLY
jgi:hypothetical protein